MKCSTSIEKHAFDMSESDDTDVLLLIPPDFFSVYSSDSEDSLLHHREWYKGHGYVASSSRVDELINQVNDLEERINLIESKGSLSSDKYISNHSHFNQSFDCAVSVDSTKFHNLGRSDLALRFYSMSSTGYRIGGESVDNAGVQCPSMHLQGAPVSVRRHLSLPSSPSPSAGLPHFTSRHDNNITSVPVKRAIFLDTVSPQNVCNMDDYHLKPDELSNSSLMSDLYENDKTKNGVLGYELRDIGFLGEIDEFLESRRKQSEVAPSSHPMKIPDEYHNVAVENTDSVSNNSFGLHSFSNLPQGNSLIKPKAVSPFQAQSVQNKTGSMDLPQVNKLLYEIENTQKEIERKLQHKERQLDRQNSTIPEYDGNYEQRMPGVNDVNKFSSQSFGLYQFMTSQNSQQLEGQNSISLPHLDTKNTLAVSNDNHSNEEFCKGFTNTKLVLNSLPDKYEGMGIDTRPSISAIKHGIGTQSAICGNVDFNARNTDVQHSFVKYPNVKPCPAENDCVKKNLSFGKENQGLPCSVLQEIDGELRSDFQDSKLSTDKLFEARKVMLFGPDAAGFPEYSFVSAPRTENDQKVEVEPPSGFTDLQNQGQPTSDKLAQGSAGDYINKKGVEIVTQMGAVKSRSGLVTGESQACDLPKLLPKPVLADSGHGLSVGTCSSSANLLSLSDLWGSETRLVRNEHMTVEQRLEEEKYRRQHCEDLIRHLQSRLLEEQQRLAVAVRVDRGKDQAILQLQDAWARLVTHWRELEEQRHKIASQLSSERGMHQQEMAEMTQKVKRYEQELSKVLDLAQGYKDKCDNAEQTIQELEEQHSTEVHDLEVKIQEGQLQLAGTREDIDQIRQEAESLKEKLKKAEDAAVKDKMALTKSQSEVKEVKKKLNTMEADVAALREEFDSVHLRLKEEKSRNSLLDQQKKSALASLEEIKKREKSLREELKHKDEMVEKVKLELRDYYQQQVEAVVREKLQEFQSQLDNAEATLHREVEEREKAASETASKQVLHITEKHQLEVRLLEEKHKEELQLYKLQLTQATQQISQLQVRLQSYSNKKTEIVEKLQGVMEAQWKEALRIISGSSPVAAGNAYQPPHLLVGNKERGDYVPKVWSGSASQLHSSSQPNLDLLSASKSSQGFESYSTHKTEPAAPFEIPVRDCKNEHVPLLHVHHSSEGSSTTDEMPFGKEDQLTFRVSQTAKSQVAHMNKEKDLQKYIRMLLNHSPGYPVDDSLAPSIGITSVSEKKPTHNWENPEGKQHDKLSSNYSGEASASAFDASKGSHLSSKDGRLSKPPWK